MGSACGYQTQCLGAGREEEGKSLAPFSPLLCPGPVWDGSTRISHCKQAMESSLFQSTYLCSPPIPTFIFSSVQFSRSIVSNSLRPHELQHARPPCPSPTPKVHPNPCPLSQLCHPTISSSVAPFSSCPQSFWVFQISQLFASDGQSVGVLASTSVLPMNTKD